LGVFFFGDVLGIIYGLTADGCNTASYATTSRTRAPAFRSSPTFSKIEIIGAQDEQTLFEL
jgi:hypothetical protein